MIDWPAGPRRKVRDRPRVCLPAGAEVASAFADQAEEVECAGVVRLPVFSHRTHMPMCVCAIRGNCSLRGDYS